MQTETSKEYSAAGKKNLEAVADAVFYNAYLERLLKKFIAPAISAADFGAGTGTFAARLARAGIAVTCIEPDSELQQLLRGQNLPVVADISDCKGCARIYSLNVLEHIEDDAAALKSIHAALAPGGKLFLYVPAFMQIYTEVDRAVGHYRRYTRPQLEKLLTGAGFVIEESRYVDSLGFFAWGLLKWMGRTGAGELNPKLVIIYDRLCFPFSLLGDLLLGKICGKNALVIATKN